MGVGPAQLRGEDRRSLRRYSASAQKVADLLDGIEKQCVVVGQVELDGILYRSLGIRAKHERLWFRHESEFPIRDANCIDAALVDAVAVDRHGVGADDLSDS